MNMNNITNILNNFGKDYLKIYVIGDVILDKYITGSCSRISQEAPVPVVLVEQEESRLGGAANIVNNIKKLIPDYISVNTISCIGLDQEGNNLLNLLNKNNINNSYIIKCDVYNTITKTRIIAMNQQIVRVDKEKPISILPMHIADIKRILNKSTKPDAIIIEDYAKGMITQDLINMLSEYKKNNPNTFIFMDPNPKSKLSYESLNFIDIFKPNLEEAIQICKFESHSNYYYCVENKTLLTELFKKIYETTNIDNILITAGKYGMYYINKGIETYHVSTTAKEVYDVCGAGDTVAAAFTLSKLNGATIEESMYISSLAAGVVVGKFGTSYVTKEEILNLI